MHPPIVQVHLNAMDRHQHVLMLPLYPLPIELVGPVTINRVHAHFNTDQSYSQVPLLHCHVVVHVSTTTTNPAHSNHHMRFELTWKIAGGSMCRGR